MINPIYKFEIEATLSGTTTTRRVYPVYGEGLTKEWTQESGERFFRETLSGELNFSGVDYSFLMGYPFGTEYRVTVYYSDTMGTGWTRYWKGRFTLTDCTVNEDDETITVTPTPVDAYDKILAGMEKEFDLIKLLPEMTVLRADKRPLLQVYRAGEGVIGCYVAGLWWEQGCSPTTDATELARCGFALCDSIKGVSVTGDITPGATGAYVISTLYGSFTATLGNYTLESIVAPYDDGEYQWVDYELFLHPTGNQLIGWRKEWRVEGTSTPSAYNGTYDLEPFGGATGVAALDFGVFEIYARILTDSETYGSATTIDLPSNDIGGMAGVYKRVAGFNDTNVVIISGASTTTPNEWGLKGPGLYYAPPASVVGAACFPMSRNSWGAFSMWFVEPVVPLDTYGVTQYTIKNAYPLASVIQKLLAQIDPSLSYFGDATCSQFFHATDIDPYFGYRLFITPKSNALSAGYDIPAMKGPITLRQVFDMLRDCFRCYWYIDGSILRIEHAKFFDNGKSYVAGGGGVGIDLTTLSVRRTGKAWATGVGRYTFDKESLPERYEFGWMDGVSKPFEGYAIDIDSPYVDAGKIEDIKVTAFTSDLDYMVCAGGECSKDGFALLCGAADANGIYKVPYFAVQQEDIDYNLQNGPLSFTYLQRYYRYDLPAVDYTINGVAMQALGLKRPKKQSVVFPTHNDPDPLRLIKTSLGNGVVEKMSVNLSSRKAEAELSYGAI